jgi:AAA domain
MPGSVGSADPAKECEMKDDVGSRAPARNNTDFDYPLPDDLRLIALEYAYFLPEGAENREWRREDWLPLYALVRELDLIGDEEDCVYSDDEATIFGKHRCAHRGRVNIIATRADAERWTMVDAYLFQSEGGNGSNTNLLRWKVLDKLPTPSDEKGGFRPFLFIDEDRYAQGMPHDADAKEWALLKENWDMFVTTVRGWVKSDADLDRYRQLKTACCGNLTAVGRALARLEAQRIIKRAPEFLVDGLVPKNNVSLLLGAMGVGKSAWLLELACDAAMGKTEFMGRRLQSGDGLVAFLYGEDSPEEVNRRAGLLCGDHFPPRLMLIRYDGRPVEEVLEREIGKASLDLLVVDPARKFYKGDEDSSDAVNAFMHDLGNFTEKKKTATIVAHHLRRNSVPRSVPDVLACMRGSQMFQDRARVVLAMFRAGAVTTLGIGKHNFDEAVMMRQPAKLRRDAAGFRHVPVAEKPAPEAEADAEQQRAAAADNVKRVKAALARIDAEGPPPGRRSKKRLGADGLFNLGLPGLAGMSRTDIREALTDLAAISPNPAGSPAAK